METIGIKNIEEQKFSVSYGDNKYTFEIRHNRECDFYYLNIYDSDNEIFLSCKKLTYNRNILTGLFYLGIGTFLGFVDTYPENTDVVTFENFGDRILLMREYSV